MATDGFLTLEFFVRPAGSWVSLGQRTIYPTTDASGIESFDLTFDMPYVGTIANPSGNDFRVAVVARGGVAANDKITGFPSVKYQADGSTPTETAVAERVRLTIVPQNG